jgi:chromosome segregation ATPase
MLMQEIERRMALLRLMLADITSREDHCQANLQQLQAQQQRVIDFAVQRNASVASALSLLAETEERQRQEEMTLRHLHALRQRAQGELDALRLTRGVSDAQKRLAELETRRQALLQAASEQHSSEAPQATPPPPTQAGELGEIEAEIAELKQLIDDASTSAARTLSQQGRE